MWTILQLEKDTETRHTHYVDHTAERANYSNHLITKHRFNPSQRPNVRNSDGT